jgi:hypothetical protein
VPENEDLKKYAKKETERLEKIISSALLRDEGFLRDEG